MTEEQLFDAYRQVVSERDQLRKVGDAMWGALTGTYDVDAACATWEILRGIGAEPPVEEFREC